MPNQRNIDSVGNLKDKAAKAKAVYLTDYRGLTHKQLEQLHTAVRANDGEYVVVKNSLLRLALGKSKEEMGTSYHGPMAALFAYNDEITPLKEMFKFIKTNALPKIKMGFFGDLAYNEAEVTRLAKLPSKQELYGQVVSRVSGPMYGLVYTLNGNLQKLVTVLGRIQK